MKLKTNAEKNENEQEDKKEATGIHRQTELMDRKNHKVFSLLSRKTGDDIKCALSTLRRDQSEKKNELKKGD